MQSQITHRLVHLPRCRLLARRLLDSPQPWVRPCLSKRAAARKARGRASCVACACAASIACACACACAASIHAASMGACSWASCALRRVSSIRIVGASCTGSSRRCSCCSGCSAAHIAVDA